MLVPQFIVLILLVGVYIFSFAALVSGVPRTPFPNLTHVVENLTRRQILIITPRYRNLPAHSHLHPSSAPVLLHILHHYLRILRVVSVGDLSHFHLCNRKIDKAKNANRAHNEFSVRI